METQDAAIRKMAATRAANAFWAIALTAGEAIVDRYEMLIAVEPLLKGSQLILSFESCERTLLAQGRN
ncbi:MAG: hypothetical protein ABIH90_02830 [Candidatus Aenigmatarchaeota archaeon]